MNHQAKYKILIVDDDVHVLESMPDLLGDYYEVLLAESGEEAIRLAEQHPDIIAAVLDIKMAPMDGLEVCRALKVIIPDIDVIFHTAYAGDYDEAEIDEQEKPFDYIQKGRNLERLARSLENIVEAYELKHRDDSFLGSDFFGLVGTSRIMRDVYRKIQSFANSGQSVLLLGETGAGKEMVAKALHACSPRRSKRFRAVHPKSDSADQNHALLFGALKGSYTGLDVDRQGVIEWVDDGTVLLDEIGDYRDDVQELLLRFLDSGEYEKLGPSDVKKSNAWVIYSTNKDLEQLVEDKNFRHDLWFRIKGPMIIVPPLRERKEDIKGLAEYFLARISIEKMLPPKFIDDGAYGVLLNHDWPGNVRELKKCIETVVFSSNSDVIFATDIADYLSVPRSVDNENGPGSLKAEMTAFEKEKIIERLIEVRGDVKAAAERLQINRANLYKKFKEHGIDPNQFRNHG